MPSIRRARRQAVPTVADENSGSARKTPRSRDAYQAKILRQHAGGFNGFGSVPQIRRSSSSRANPPRPLARPGLEQGRERARADYSQTLITLPKPERVIFLT